jgi:uncharacterized C2H2 Zn-finger protein
MKEKEIQRTEPCPKCTMTFRIEQSVKQGLICPDCALVFKERNTGAGGNAILSVDSLGPVLKAWA